MDVVRAVDAWAEERGIVRAEAIRRLIEAGLRTDTPE